MPTASAVEIRDRLHSALLVVESGAVHSQAGDTDKNRQRETEDEGNVAVVSNE